MARRLSAEWRERLASFQDSMGTSADFCRHEGISRSSLYLWSRRLRVPVISRSRPGTGLARVRAKPKVDCSPFAAVRVRPAQATVGEPALQIVLPNGTRLEVPGRDPELLRLVVEAVLRHTGSAGEERRCWPSPLT